ncbi:MAG: ROK family protein [Alphaproteobacteria bacterium]|nr:ROK family protein [Alphaproteobacteria bacterium]
MGIAIGLDIGGTKIAGAAFDDGGVQVAESVTATPADYPSFLAACRKVVDALGPGSIGVGIPNGAANMPFLVGKDIAADLARAFGRPVRLGNDANCAALAEAIDGAGQGYDTVFGLILGTGVGGGFVVNGRMIAGANGTACEIGHVPLPYYEPSDGSLVPCGCGQKGCIEQLLNGAALARLHYELTDDSLTAKNIATMASKGNKDALATLDRYFTTLAKAMVAILHTFDPDIITVSGGLNALPAMYDEIPKRWGQYALAKNPKTKFVPAKHGAMAGLRGAAWLGGQT